MPLIYEDKNTFNVQTLFLVTEANLIVPIIGEDHPFELGKFLYDYLFHYL